MCTGSRTLLLRHCDLRWNPTSVEMIIFIFNSEKKNHDCLLEPRFYLISSAPGYPYPGYDNV